MVGEVGRMPVLKSSSTRRGRCRAASASTRCDPIKPAPPVTRQSSDMEHPVFWDRTFVNWEVYSDGRSPVYGPWPKSPSSIWPRSRRFGIAAGLSLSAAAAAAMRLLTAGSRPFAGSKPVTKQIEVPSDDDAFLLWPTGMATKQAASGPREAI